MSTLGDMVLPTRVGMVQRFALTSQRARSITRMGREAVRCSERLPGSRLAPGCRERLMGPPIALLQPRGRFSYADVPRSDQGAPCHAPGRLRWRCRTRRRRGGMQPSRELEGKPAVKGRGNNAGRRSLENRRSIVGREGGRPLERARQARLGCSRRPGRAAGNLQERARGAKVGDRSFPGASRPSLAALSQPGCSSMPTS